MGLDTSHNCWHGSYTAFMHWRQKLAEVAGLPPMELMEGFYSPLQSRDLPTLYHGPETKTGGYLDRLDARLPIKWECLKPGPIHTLLNHSDCDGEIEWAVCDAIADSLECLLPLLPQEPQDGHIGDWKQKTQQFIAGLRRAAQAHENVDFH